jgi:uncharacterized protein YdeI (YjbR/CyaY-like superfamily)
LKTLDVPTCAQWRKWLAAHHEMESEIWLVFYKRKTGRPSVDYHDALDEALCFGWIDSLVKRLDDERFARKFTPRKADSKWSAVNRKRYAQLRAAGRLTAAGLKRAPTNRRYDAPRQWPTAVPPYIRQALKKHPAAWRTFEHLAPSYRRLYVGWIDAAKRPETKTKRLREAIDLLAAGKKLGLK